MTASARPSTRRLIVNADDLGLSQAINGAIARAHIHGVLSSASLVANGLAFEDAVSVSRANPKLDVGVHLTLVEERPLLSASEIPSLVDSEGRFHDNARRFVGRFLSGRIRLREVRKELEAQLSRIRDSGIRPTHLDGHQHLHVLPGLFPIVAELACRHSIPVVRRPVERLIPRAMFGRVSPWRTAEQLVLGALAAQVTREAAEVRHPDAWIGFTFGGRLNRANLRWLLEHSVWSGTCELMCHPGLPDPEGPHARWGYDGPGELEALLDPRLPELLEELGIGLTSFRDWIAGKATVAPQANS